MFALADCNNFFASCQRIFRPDLNNKPIVILSNNDGCIIARSNEAKALGIPMGAPEYKWHSFLKQHKVEVFSSNYTLYGDISARVMRILERFESNIEIYSIDEAFLDIQGISDEKLRAYALEMRQTVLQWTGMPISIGIAPTKTLAKIATHQVKEQAKKHIKTGGVGIITSKEDALCQLKQTNIANVWGVGRAWAEKLRHDGIHTAADLMQADHSWIRRRYSVVLQRTAMELSGRSCISLEETPVRQQILVSRSFRPKVTDYQTLRSLIAGYISRAAEKLRGQKSLAKSISIFIHTKSQDKQTSDYSNSININLSQYTADTTTLIRAAIWGLKKLYRPGYQYYRAGITFNHLIPDKHQQYALFSPVNYDATARKRMQLLDYVNRRFGPETLTLASEPRRRWQMYQKHLSPTYTTRWDELLLVY